MERVASLGTHIKTFQESYIIFLRHIRRISASHWLTYKRSCLLIKQCERKHQQKIIFSKRTMSTDIPIKKRKKTCENLVTLNKKYTGQLLQDFKTNYLQKKTFNDEETGCRLYQEPFCHCVFPNFLQELDELENLETELSSLQFKEKNNDLYKFHQSSEDLKVIDTPYIKNLRKVIFETFKNHLRDISGIDFTEAIDMSCARYDYTDILLCHDDELEGRRIAFIYYLKILYKLKSTGNRLNHEPSKYKELKKAFCDPDITWNLTGPANKRHVLCGNLDNMPAVIQECLEFLQSDAMFLILSHLTGLKLHKLYEPSDNSDSEDETTEGQNQRSIDGKTEPSCYSEVRHWKHGCYTLVHDTCIEGTQFALDSVLYIGGNDWKLEYGGFTSYIAKGDDEELLSIHPKENSLALVYRDKETLRFVKHVNNDINKMADQGFYDISTVVSLWPKDPYGHKKSSMSGVVEVWEKVLVSEVIFDNAAMLTFPIADDTVNKSTTLCAHSIDILVFLPDRSPPSHTHTYIFLISEATVSG
ncbi:hypothetical protein KUTeg_016472, partial [Tegillarca granosa]